MANSLSRIVSSGFKQGNVLKPINMEWYAKYSETGFTRLDSAWTVLADSWIIYYPLTLRQSTSDWIRIGELRDGQVYYTKNTWSNTMPILVSCDGYTYTYDIILPDAPPNYANGGFRNWAYSTRTNLLCNIFTTRENEQFVKNVIAGVDILGGRVSIWDTYNVSDVGYYVTTGIPLFEMGLIVQREVGGLDGFTIRQYPSMTAHGAWFQFSQSSINRFHNDIHCIFNSQNTMIYDLVDGSTTRYTALQAPTWENDLMPQTS